MEFSGFPTCCPFHACLKSKQPQEKNKIKKKSLPYLVTWQYIWLTTLIPTRSQCSEEC